MAIAAQPHYIQEEASAGRESSLAAVFFFFPCRQQNPLGGTF
jgi:hypothetical protein